MIRLKTLLLLLAGAFAVLLCNVLAVSHKASRLSAPSAFLDGGFAPETLALSHPPAPALVFKKGDDGVWRLVKPVAVAIDASKVLRLLDALQTTSPDEALSFVELAKLDLTRQDFGLLDPRLKVALSDGERSRLFSFGNLTPASNGVYVAASESDAVYVAPRALLEAADLSFDDVRAHELFAFDASAVTGFDVRLPSEAVSKFVRTNAGWTLNGRTALRKTVDDFLRLLLKTRIESFVWPQDLAERLSAIPESRLVGYALDDASAVSVVCHVQDGRDVRLLLGRETEEGRVYALSSEDPSIVALAPALKSACRALAKASVDVRLFPVEASSVSSVTLQKDAVSYVLSRDAAGAWAFESPLLAPANGALVATLLGRILSATADDESPQGVAVSLSSSRTPHRLSEAALLGGSRLEDLRSREILRLDPALVKRLVVTPGRGSKSRAATFVRSRLTRTWQLEGASAPQESFDQDALAEALAALNPLVAETIVALAPTPSDAARLGLDSPFLTISVDQEKEGSLRRNLLIGSKTPSGGRYATVGSSESIFVLSKKTLSVLEAL